MTRLSSQAGLTLTELLIVVAVIAVLAAVLIPNLLGARRSTQQKIIVSYVQQCVTAAESRRSLITGDAALPGSCDTLAPAPANVTSTVTLSGNVYTITATGPAGAASFSASATLAKVRP